MARVEHEGPDPRRQILEKIEKRSLSAAVVGLGYVGLPLALEMARSGYRVVGVDSDSARATAVNEGRSYIGDVVEADLKSLVADGRLSASDDYAQLADCDAVVICVPTPLRKTRDPDLSFIIAAVKNVARYLKPGKLVVLESTTYPGTTEELVRPMLEEGGMRAGTEFFLAFSPERVDPGPAHSKFNIVNVPKVVGGVTAACTEVASAFYGAVVDTVVPVSSSRVAEMVKLLENTFRSVNIAMANELALMCHEMGLDVWEVIEAAKTKPYGFQAFYPGPGLGGHCIPVDPFYLAWKARLHGFEPRFIELAGQVNTAMPKHVVTLAADLLNEHTKPLRGSRVHLLGMAYKPDVSDLRESPALIIAEMLIRRGAELTFSDPHVDSVRLETGQVLTGTPAAEAPLEEMDLVIVVTDHRAFPWAEIVRRSPLILDTRNALKGVKGDHIHRL